MNSQNTLLGVIIMYKKTKSRYISIVPGYMAAACAYLRKINFFEIIDERVNWDSQRKVSVSILLAVIILNSFTDINAPLYKIKDAFEKINTEFLFGEGIKPELFTESILGDALEALYEANAFELFNTLSLFVFKKFELTIDSLHGDTSTITYFGDFNDKFRNKSRSYLDIKGSKHPVKIVRGYNKDHRPDCKQVKINQICNGEGVILYWDIDDGNKTDIDFNNDALDFLKSLKENFDTSFTIYVADCKAVNKKLFLSMNDKDEHTFFISLVPANFASKLQEKMKKKAYEENNWHKVGKITDKENACTYEIQEFEEMIYGYKTRLVVVKSDANIANFEENQIKMKKIINDEIKKLVKKVFKCEKEAELAWEQFFKKYKNAPYKLSMNIRKIITEKRPRGNPGKNPKPPRIIVEWALDIKLEDDDEAMTLARQKAESFVLISNVPKPKKTEDNITESESKDSITITAEEILKRYKSQSLVELNFKVMKSPSLLLAKNLQKPERIEAMIMLIGVSLMIRGLILSQLKKGFKESGENPRINYTGGKITSVTIGLFKYAMNSFHFEKTKNGNYTDNLEDTKKELRVKTLLSYLDMDISDLVFY